MRTLSRKRTPVADELPGGYRLPAPSQPKRGAAPKKKSALKPPAAAATVAPPGPADNEVGSGKNSGSQNRKAQRERQAAEQAAHDAHLAAAGQLALDLEPCTDPEKAHLYQIRVLMNIQHRVLTNPHITAEAKVRHVTQVAQALGRIKVEAELQQRIAQLEEQRATEVADLQADRREVEITRRRNEAEQQRLDEEWSKLRAEQERTRIAAAPTPSAV